MTKQKRRSFLKTTVWSGLALGSLSCAPLRSAASGAAASEVAATRGNTTDGIREAFPLVSRKVYFNTASLGPSPQVVMDSICENMQRLETRCYTGRNEIYVVHDKLGAMLNVAPETIALTRNATEGANIAARSLPLQPGDEVIISNHEHVGGASPWLALMQQQGIKVIVVALDITGERNLDIIKAAITPKTKVVAVSHVTCSNGMVLPIAELTAYCRARGIYTAIDGAQALGMFPIDLQALAPDFYFASGHKWLFGPKGTGILYINPDIMEVLQPTFVGAYSDEIFDLEGLEQTYRMVAQREEYGTRNTPITLGLGAAIDFVNGIGLEVVAQKSQALVAHFREELGKLPQVTLLSPENTQFASSILTFRVAGHTYQEVQVALNQPHNINLRGVYEAQLEGVRISCAAFNSHQEVDYMMTHLRNFLSA